MRYNKSVVNVVWNELGYSVVSGFLFVSNYYILASVYFRVLT